MTTNYGRDQGYINNNDRDTCVCVIIEAERDLNQQLSYRSKFTLLSKLMQRFHKTLHDHEDIRNNLLKLFEQVKATFQEIPSFTEFTEHLKSQLGDFVASMTYRLEVDFESYNPVNFFHALRLQASENGAARTLDEMGTGEQQILALSFAYAYARAFHGGILLVIEEPEAHLHPLAQQWLGRRLHDMCKDGLQIVLTTHSPHFIDLMNLEGLVLVRKDSDGTKAIQVSRKSLVTHCIASGTPAAKTTVENILPFYRANATPAILEGFFAKVIVLAEGPTEALALPIYLEKCGLHCSKEGIAIISVQGKGNLAKWRRLFTAYGIPTYIVFDNDTGDDREGTKRRDALCAVGITGETDQATYITTKDWIIESEFSVFGADFEHILRATYPCYAEFEDEAKREGIDSKPFIARWVAERMDYDDGDPAWDHFRTIAKYLQAFVPLISCQQPNAETMRT